MTSAAALPISEPLQLLLDVLRARGPLTRADLGAATGLSRTTVSGLLAGLRRLGLVDDAPDSAGQPTGGRPATLVTFGRDAGLAVGVDLGRRHLRVIVSDLGHHVVAESGLRLEVDGHADAALDRAASVIDDLLAGLSRDRSDVLGVGLGVPAPLDRNGVVGSSNILPGWVGRSPAHELQQRLELPVLSDNDANLGALAEAVWGAGRDVEQVVYLKVATGIGAGIVLGGRILHGVGGTAGEIGHTTVTDNGAVCRCGNRGCLELLVGGPALVDELRQSGLSVAGVPDIVELARAGDAGCLRVLADVGDRLGLAVANLVNLLNPEVVVFGGDLSAAGELVLTTLRARVQRSAIPAAASSVRVVSSALGDRAEALGGVLLVLREAAFGPRLLSRALAPA
jgi:predicted NBD/HSP70 family sugar kinase